MLNEFTVRQSEQSNPSSKTQTGQDAGLETWNGIKRELMFGCEMRKLWL
jgi:hypothetical protein